MGLRGWLEAQKVPASLGSSQKRAKTVQQFSSYDLLIPAWAPYNYNLFVRQAYRTNALVRECIEYRARSVALATMYAYRRSADDKGKEKLSEGHWLQRLLRRPSDLYSTQTRWLRQIERHLLITGECFIYLAAMTGSKGRGQIGETQILDGSVVSVLPGKTGIAGYEYKPHGAVKPIPIPKERMIYLRYDDPEDTLRGCSPLLAAWREIQTDNEMVNYRKGFFQNSAILSGILTTEAPANAEQLRTWAEDFTDLNSGADKSGRTAALAGGLTYQPIGTEPKSIDFQHVGAIPETRICMAFSVHPILIAAKHGLDRSTYSNFKEAHAAYWEDTVVPEMELIQDEFTVSLTSAGDPNFIEFDASGVPAMQPDAELTEAIARNGLINGATTVNEYRQKLGHNAVPDGGVYYRPGSLTPVPEGELDAPPPDPMEMLQAQTDAEIQKGNALAKAKDPTADKGGKPADKKKDQDTPPQPGSANDREAEIAYDERLLEILDTEHRSQSAAIEGGFWDRPLYVARISGSVRKRLGRIARTANPTLDPDQLTDWLDVQTIELGNEAAQIAPLPWGDLAQEELLRLAAKYTHRALQAFATEPVGSGDG